MATGAVSFLTDAFFTTATVANRIIRAMDKLDINQRA